MLARQPAAEHAAFLEQAFTGKPEETGSGLSTLDWMRVTSIKAESCDRRAGMSLLQISLAVPAD